MSRPGPPRPRRHGRGQTCGRPLAAGGSRRQGAASRSQEECPIRARALTALAAALPLLACAPLPDQPTGGPPTASFDGGGTCDATLYADLAGEPAERVGEIRPGVPVRVLGPDDFVTRDYDPGRLTVTLTPDDTIGRVFCG